MTIKEKLIEELHKDNWIIDTYLYANRAIELFKILRESNYQKQYKVIYGENIYRFIFYIKTRDVIDDSMLSSQASCRDLTQLFNQYLMEYHPHAWQHSVLAAIQLDLKVELNEDNRGNWCDTWEVSPGLVYRIDYKQPKLIDDDVWQFIDKKWGAIAKERDESVYLYSEPYSFDLSGYFYKHISGDSSLFTAHKHFTNIKLNDVPWEESLTVRPKS